MKTARPGPNQNFEKEVDVPIEIRPLVEDRIGMVLAARGEQRRKADRQRGCTRFAGARPAQADKKRHVRILVPAF